MSAGPLRLGLSACFFHADPARAIFKGKTLLYLEESLAHWAQSEGDLAYLIPTPPAGAAGLRALVEPLDGLLLQGGSDVSPLSYGERPLRPEWAGDKPRDDYELALLKEFRAQGKPVLGVCRGAQLLNVAFGGTLYQDIQTQSPEAVQHRDWELYDQNFHALSLERGSMLERLLGGQAPRRVNSVHHQAVKSLGPGLAVQARCAADGLVEAVATLEGPWTLALQWHPEFQDPSDAGLLDGRPVLHEFLSQARQGRKG